MKSTSLAFVVRLATGIPLHGGLPAADRPRVYYANHSSHLDFVAIWAALPKRLRQRTRPVAAAEYWEKGKVRPWLASRMFRAVLIPRNPARMRRENPVDLMHKALEDGADLILFPEGTRSPSGTIGEFKSGFHHLVERIPNLELVPVYLENLNRILPKGEHVPLPLMGHIRFGEPLPGLLADESRESFLTRTRSALVDLSHGNLTHAPDE